MNYVVWVWTGILLALFLALGWKLVLVGMLVTMILCGIVWVLDNHFYSRKPPDDNDT